MSTTDRSKIVPNPRDVDDYEWKMQSAQVINKLTQDMSDATGLITSLSLQVLELNNAANTTTTEEEVVEETPTEIPPIGGTGIETLTGDGDIKVVSDGNGNYVISSSPFEGEATNVFPDANGNLLGIDSNGNTAPVELDPDTGDIIPQVPNVPELSTSTSGDVKLGETITVTATVTVGGESLPISEISKEHTVYFRVLRLGMSGESIINLTEGNSDASFDFNINTMGIYSSDTLDILVDIPTLGLSDMESLLVIMPTIGVSDDGFSYADSGESLTISSIVEVDTTITNEMSATVRLRLRKGSSDSDSVDDIPVNIDPSNPSINTINDEGDTYVVVPKGSSSVDVDISVETFPVEGATMGLGENYWVEITLLGGSCTELDIKDDYTGTLTSVLACYEDQVLKVPANAFFIGWESPAHNFSLYSTITITGTLTLENTQVFGSSDIRYSFGLHNGVVGIVQITKEISNGRIISQIGAGSNTLNLVNRPHPITTDLVEDYIFDPLDILIEYDTTTQIGESTISNSQGSVTGTIASTDTRLNGTVLSSVAGMTISNICVTGILK